jgi:hypothetical protein
MQLGCQECLCGGTTEERAGEKDKLGAGALVGAGGKGMSCESPREFPAGREGGMAVNRLETFFLLLQNLR